ncbi:MAG: hypothetical protein FJW38_08375 [Acidobacteria bacterium]|nr:hypothetical protein [Acidobacteriota bacterium]
MSPVKQDLLELLEKRQDAEDWERALVRMAISLFDLVEDPEWKSEPAVRFRVHEYHAIPTGRFELIEGRLHPKHWDPVEFRKFKREES